MLSDFIKNNSLSARVINKKLLRDSGSKCKLVRNNNQYFLLVFSAKKEVNFADLEANFGLFNVRVCDELETEQVTGYNYNFLPPVSIYGVVTILDESVLNFEKLYFFIEVAKTLEISLFEIEEFSEELKKGSFTM